jgi:5-methylcytosine-specific restriction endonuclease McrA
MRVFVLDTNKQPLAPTTPRRARLLLTNRQAAVFRRYPFTIILKRAVENPQIPDLRLKIDPGSKVTGLAVVNQTSGEVVFAAELEHRGQRIKDALDGRRAVRGHRRARNTRYRPARFLNRTGRKGMLPPSLMSRVFNTETWVRRIRQYCRVSGLSMELVKFDTQLMQNPEISGVEYQQGTLQGYEAREYLIEKWDRKCAYCSKRNVPLQVEHIIPRSRGGSKRISNLTLACQPCNQRKGNKTAAEFGFPEIQKQAQASLKDAAAMNASRWFLYHRLIATGLSIETGSGGLTKFNRTTRGLHKSHWIDAACVGKSTPEPLHIESVQPLVVKATGHGSRQMTNVNKFGFPRGLAKGARVVHGFRTGDIVKATVPNGKRKGIHIGRVAIRLRGHFKIATTRGSQPDISWRHIQRLHSADGYGYHYLQPRGGH